MFTKSSTAPLLIAALRAIPLFAANRADASSLSSPPPDDPPLWVAQLGTVEVESTRLGGPGLAPSGSADYSVTQEDILNLPEGQHSKLTDVLTRMPGVSIDQNQQIHVRDTEGPQFQYQIDGVMVPLDINTNPPFLSMINPMFVRRIDLLTGVLPARYGYATGGVVDIETRQGCAAPGGSLSIFTGQRGTFQPSIEQSGCNGRLSYFVSGLYDQSNTAFSSATPGPSPHHDRTRGGQALGVFGYPLSPATSLEAVLAGAASDNQLPNVPGLEPRYALAGLRFAFGRHRLISQLPRCLGSHRAEELVTPGSRVAARLQLPYHRAGLPPRRCRRVDLSGRRLHHDPSRPRPYARRRRDLAEA